MALFLLYNFTSLSKKFIQISLSLYLSMMNVLEFIKIDNGQWPTHKSGSFEPISRVCLSIYLSIGELLGLHPCEEEMSHLN